MTLDAPRRELHLYQDEAVDFVLEAIGTHECAGLFMDMGLGKTATVLHALLELPRPVLLVGPIRVVETVWAKEASLWPATKRLRFSLLRGTPSEREKAAEVDADVYLVNPELLAEALEYRGYAGLVVDESTMFKNPSTSRFKILRKHLHKFKFRIILTGTPTPNSLLDLWSQVFLLDRGARLDRAYGRFQQKYFYPADYQGYKFVPHSWATEEVVGKIKDVVHRVAAEDVLPARQPLKNIILTPLPPGAQAQYTSMETLAIAEISEDKYVTAATAATKMMKLRQAASGFLYGEEREVHQLHRAKIDALQSVLNEASSPVIVVYQFRHELEALKKAFPQGEEFESGKEEAWNKGDIPLLFLHPQSGGHGLNLQYGGHTMVIYSGSFSLEQMQQVMGRIDRQGQKFPCVFHFLVAPGTVDELLMNVLEERAKDQNTVLRMIKEYVHAKHDSH